MTPLLPDSRYPYSGPAFARFVADSWSVCGNGDYRTFFRWMDDAAQVDWRTYLAEEKRRLKPLSGAERTDAERALATTLHHRIKTLIPRFSLDRGFEFVNVVRYGERQCLLQSVLLSALFQQVGIPAGVAMVWRSERGELSNNGHAVTVAALAGGADLLVDCSDPTPFARHQGLFMANRRGGYRFVRPTYDGPRIVAYQAVDTAQRVRVTPLSTAFLSSQFYFYRGERTPKGPLEKKPTAEGMATAERFLQEGVRRCPQNPLLVYYLGRVQWRQDKRPAGRDHVEFAARLYERYGWTPEGARDALALVHSAEKGPRS
jgi:hypothetical protein